MKFMRAFNISLLVIFVSLALSAQNPTAPGGGPSIPTPNGTSTGVPTDSPKDGLPCAMAVVTACNAAADVCVASGGNPVACETASSLTCIQPGLLACKNAETGVGFWCIVGLVISIILILALVALTVFVSVKIVQEVIKRVKPRSILGWIVAILISIILVVIVIIIAVVIFKYVLVPVITFIMKLSCSAVTP